MSGWRASRPYRGERSGMAASCRRRRPPGSPSGSTGCPTSPRSRPAPEGEVDVAVIGGGITGITTALLLKRGGARVAVIEAARVGSGVTGATTAKVTALQSTVLSEIRRRHGDDAAAVYAQASAAAVEQVGDAGRASSASTATSPAGPPSPTRRTSRTWTPSTGEHEAARAAGLPVELVDGRRAALSGRRRRAPGRPARAPPRPLRPRARRGGRRRRLRRARGHPRAERRRRHAVPRDDRPAPTVAARHVVVATHYPLLDRGLFFARLEPMRSYCVAARVTRRAAARDVDQRGQPDALDPLPRRPA